MQNDDHTRNALQKRKSDAPKAGLIDLSDRLNVAAFAAVVATLVLIASDAFIRFNFGQIKYNRTWHADWDSAIASEFGWVWFLVIAAWIVSIAYFATAPRVATK
jgi:flagellar biosynthesis protein FlhB